MIRTSDISYIGFFLKPHGIKGEIAAELDIDEEDISALSCIICDMDGIYVPFYIESVRTKGQRTLLLTIDGVCDEKQAALFSGKNIYAKSNEVLIPNEDEGVYVSDMVGFTIISNDGKGDGKEIGIIDRIDDYTANILFIVKTANGETVYIPAVEEFISRLDLNKHIIEMNLPQGLID